MSDQSIETILAAQRSSFPLAVSAYVSLLQQMPFLRRSLGGFVGRQDEIFWADSEERCREIVQLSSRNAGAIRAAVSAWVDFSAEYLARQNRFLATGRYACTSFEQIQQDLYENRERMEKYYLPALMVSFIFSSNYIGVFRFFREQLLPRIARARAVCEVGCGHGVYLSQMLRAAPDACGTGLDISQTCLDTTRVVLTHHHIPQGRFRLERADLRDRLPLEDETQQAVACFEVIEHLEDSLHALRELRRILRRDGWLCLSTAIRMESIDHLHVFVDAEQVRSLLADAGLKVLTDRCVPLTNQDASDPIELKRLIEDPGVSLGYVALAG